MPTYEYTCSCGKSGDHFRRVDYRDSAAPWCCGKPMLRTFTVPMLISSRDICYDSPIDGRPITSMKERREDLARNNCRPYDPGMKVDVERQREASDKALEKAVDQTIDKEIATMPAVKRDKLVAEMQGGITAEVVRHG